MIIQSGKEPLYMHIKKYVLKQIAENNLDPSGRIPTENALAEQFEVSRVTVRSAMLELENEGIIYRIRGKGSFVSPTYADQMHTHDDTQQTRRNNFIAFIMPRVISHFNACLLDGIEEEATEQGYHLIFCKTHDDQAEETKIIRKIVQSGAAGIIIYPVEGETYNEDILRQVLNKYPVVVVDRYLRGVETNCVCSDNIDGAYKATKHLIDLGHRHIGFISTFLKGTTSLEDRLTGYENALADHHVPIDHRLRLFLENENQDTQKQIRTFISENSDVSAILAVNLGLGITVIKEALKIERRVPEDLSVVFFDDHEQSSFFIIPPTTLVQNAIQMGKESVKLLTSFISDPKQQYQKIYLPTNLIVRNSTTKYTTGANKRNNK